MEQINVDCFQLVFWGYAGCYVSRTYPVLF